MDFLFRRRALESSVLTGLALGVFLTFSMSYPDLTLARGIGPVSYSDAAAKALPAVVNVAIEKRSRPRRGHGRLFEPFFDRGNSRGERAEQGVGSGVLVGDGYILTNNHVIEGASRVVVTLNDGRALSAKVVGADAKSDVGLLRVDEKNLPSIEWGDSRKLKIADVVLAIGNPFGVGQTVTMGIVSAKGRTNVDIVDYEDFIQTDAAINPGNSGGALVDATGKLVGINTAIYSRSGGSQGIGFAIPVAMARPIMEAIKKNGVVERGYLGVVIQDVSRGMLKALKLSSTRGALVSDVQEGSPAESAGLRHGDVVVEVDGKEIKDTQSLRNEVALVPPGTRVRVVVMRDGAREGFSITVGRLGGPVVKKRKPKKSSGHALRGISVSAVPSGLARDNGLRDGVGVLVKELVSKSPAARQGLRAGDIILEINRERLRQPDDFYSAAEDAGKEALLRIVRRGNVLYWIVRSK